MQQQQVVAATTSKQEQTTAARNSNKVQQIADPHIKQQKKVEHEAATRNKQRQIAGTNSKQQKNVAYSSKRQHILGALEASWTILGQCRSRLDPLRLFFYHVGRIASSNYQQIAANDSSKKQQLNSANSRSK